MYLDDNPYEGVPLIAGPQDDGTYVSPVMMPQPVDAGGGNPGNYSAQVLDVFKWGVGIWQNRQAQQDMLDYRRWEATQGGIAQQGKAAGVTAGGQPAGIPKGLLLAGAVIAAVLILRPGK